jgi:hypothetical protein
MPMRKALGAWEVATRFSELDLTNGDVNGDVQRDLTVGLNWWTNANVMFRLNYVYGKQRCASFRDKRAHPRVHRAGASRLLAGFRGASMRRGGSNVAYRLATTTPITSPSSLISGPPECPGWIGTLICG